MNFKSINQVAQEDGDTTANEMNRIREREREVKVAWRTFMFNNDTLPTIKDLQKMVDYPEHFIRFVCGSFGYEISHTCPDCNGKMIQTKNGFYCVECRIHNAH